MCSFISYLGSWNFYLYPSTFTIKSRVSELIELRVVWLRERFFQLLHVQYLLIINSLHHEIIIPCSYQLASYSMNKNQHMYCEFSTVFPPTRRVRKVCGLRKLLNREYLKKFDRNSYNNWWNLIITIYVLSYVLYVRMCYN